MLDSRCGHSPVRRGEADPRVDDEGVEEGGRIERKFLEDLNMSLSKELAVPWLVGEATVSKTIISSGNMRKFEYIITVLMLFMKRLNTRVPRWDPWGNSKQDFEGH